MIVMSIGTIFVSGSMAESAGGSDFGVFYTAGLTLSRLYDPDYVKAVRQVVGLTGYAPYLNPPFYALMMVPLVLLPFETALAIWRCIGVGMAIVSTYLMARMLGLRHWPIYALILMGSLSSAWAYALGQNSYLLLFIMVVAIYLLHIGKDTGGGLVLSLLLIKPHLAMLLPLALVSLRRWKAIRGWLCGACFLYFASALIAGWAWPVHYLQLIASPNVFPTNVLMSNRMRSLTGILAPMLAGISPIAFGLTLLAITAVGFLLVRSSDLHRSTAMSVVLGILFTPYMLSYDMLLLAWPCMVLVSAEPLYGPLTVMALLVLLWAGSLYPMSWQPVVLAIVAVSVLIGKQKRRPRSREGGNWGRLFHV